MSQFSSKLSERIFRDRIKAFVIIQIIFFTVYLIIAYYGLKDKSVNYFYIGLGQIILAGFWFLMGIEHILLKKNKISIFYFISSILFIYLAIQSYDLLNIKR